METNSMKKFFSVVLILLFTLVSGGCGNPETYKHNHDFNSETVAPTCSQDGYTMHTCKTCGFKMRSDIVPPQQNGEHTYNNCVCIECGDFLVDEAIDTVTLSYTKAIDDYGNDFYSVTGNTIECEYIKIPSMHNGIPVKQIADEAFCSLRTLKHVVIPNSVISIGKGAFKYCFNLMSTHIPDSVVLIGEDAFWDCHNLKQVSFGSVTEIHDYTFIGCDSITNIKLPNGVTKIGVHAFGDCYDLTDISIPISLNEISHAAFWDCRNLKNIHYEGTIEQWHAIHKEVGIYTNTNKDASWNAYTGEYTVHCSDGQINKS